MGERKNETHGNPSITNNNIYLIRLITFIFSVGRKNIEEVDK